MSEKKALYQKYRPTRLSEIIGQDHAKRLIENSVKQGRISHAYLFTGLRGSGKTSLARIFSRIVNCENAPSVDYSDDDKFIKKINEGSFLDIKELDAASNTSIDDIRQIRSEAYDAPIMGKKRVFIIDEVHILKESAISALLKILEEPPETAMFILATTDPQKVKATIHSRCQIVKLREIGLNTLSSYLKDIAKKEGVKNIEEGSIELVSLAAKGSVRDGLSLLDSVIGRCGLSIEKKDVEDIVGCIDQVEIFKLVKCISQIDKKKAMIGLIKFIKVDGKDPKYIFNSLLEMWHDLLLSKTLNKVNGILFIDPKIQEEWVSVRESFSTREINFCLQTTAKFMTDLNYMPRADFMLDSLIISLIDGISALRNKN